MEKREYVLSLYEIYSNLLTDKEKKYFEDYYFEDFSFQEIALNNEVSKAYVGKYINGILNKLESFEEALKLFEKKNKIIDIINEIDEDIRNKIIELL